MGGLRAGCAMCGPSWRIWADDHSSAGDPSAPAGASYQLALGAFLGCTLLLIPLSFGFAMLHARLWDIDVLINRTLVYGTLTVILTAVYVGLVIGLQALLRGLISHDSGVPSSFPRWRSTFCSSRSAVASNRSLIAVSIVANMMQRRSWQPSAPPCARK